MTKNSQIAANLKLVLQALRNLEKKYQRPANSVQLLAVSKKKSITDILAASSAGQIQFGESYAQEAIKKINELSNIKLYWHFIGPLQKNKTRLIAEHFQWVHSIDRLLVAQRLNQQRPKSLPTLQVCIQVNIDNESSKSGVNIQDVQSLAEDMAKLKHLQLRGLMAIPQVGKEIHQQRKSFAKLRQQLEHLNQQGFGLDTLSMGMSGDLEAAIAEGSTIVRVGTAIFGNRVTTR